MNAQKPGEFALEMKEGARVGQARIEVTKGAQKEVEEFRDGMLGFGDQLDEFDEIGGEPGAQEIGAQADEGLDEDRLAKGMQVALSAGSVADIDEEEEVEFAGKGAAGAAGAFCGGLEAAMGLGQPRDNPTGIAKANAAQNYRGGAVQGDESFDERGQIGKKSFMPEETTQPSAVENTPAITTENLKTTYANVYRIAQTPNEVIVDFGMNPNIFGPILPEPLKLESRVILSHDGAKRLLLHLAAAIQGYEAKYGVIELDVAKRIKQPAGN